MWLAQGGLIDQLFDVSWVAFLRGGYSESATCASHVEVPNPTGGDRRQRRQNDRGVQKEDGRT